MDQQTPTKILKDKILALLQKAEDTKETNIKEAISILYDAAKLLHNFSSDNDKKSDKNVTQGNDSQEHELQYLSKRGNILYDLKGYGEAAACYKTVIEKVPQSYEMIRAYGDCLRKQKLYDAAIDQYNIGLEKVREDEESVLSDEAPLLNSRGLAYIGKNDYKSALADFDKAIEGSGKNPLYHCNKGYAAYVLGDKETAITHFMIAKDLVKDRHLGGLSHLTKNNVGYIEGTLEKFITKLQNLKNIHLKTKDPTMVKREINFVGRFMRQISLKGDEEPLTDIIDEEPLTDIIDEEAKLETTKKSLRDIQNDQQLHQYYDGFGYTLWQSYETSGLINSNTFELKTSNAIVNVVAAAISVLLPLVGNHLSNGIKSLHKYIKEGSISRAASNITKCATFPGEFEALAQDVVCEAILKNETKIKELQDAEIQDVLLPKWASQFKDIVDKIGKSTHYRDVFWKGERNETLLQKLGYSTATTLVSETIAKEEYWKPNKAVNVSPADKREKLVESALKIMDRIFDSATIPISDKEDKTNKRR